MLVHVCYAAQARVAAGCDHQAVALADDATVVQLLQTLADTGPAELRGFLFRNADQVQPTLMIVRNDIPIPRRELSTLVLADRDEITIVPPLAGG